MNKNLHPYVVFLPSDAKTKILSSIFGSKAAVDILRFSLKQGISSKIYQKELVRTLEYSNKTVIQNLKVLTRLTVLKEEMEKEEKKGRTVWVKAYEVSDVGRWFALLLAEEKELSQSEKSEILQDLFRAYIRWVKDLSEQLHLGKDKLEEVFKEEMNLKGS